MSTHAQIQELKNQIKQLKKQEKLAVAHKCEHEGCESRTANKYCRSHNPHTCQYPGCTNKCRSDKCYRHTEKALAYKRADQKARRERMK